MQAQTAFERVVLEGTQLDAVTEEQLVAGVREALDRGTGGRILTPNVDILRQSRTDQAIRAFLADATYRVADGTPLIWASRLAGTPLPERVTGASLFWSLAGGLAEDGRSVYLLGGEPATPAPAVLPAARTASEAEPTDPARTAYAAGLADAHAALGGVTRTVEGATRTVDGATRAAGRLAARYPGLRIAGSRSPVYGFDRDAASVTAVCQDVIEAKPDLVYVGLGFPKQEWIITRLRNDLPSAWFLGCGMAINFAAGDQPRAPLWMQRVGLEWAHRLRREPRRLAGRYLRHDAPYALRLLAAACVTRASRRDN